MAYFYDNNFDQSDFEPAAEFLAKEQDALAENQQVTVPREEPVKNRNWRQKQKRRLRQKDEEKKKKSELREQVKKEFINWYKHNEEFIGKTKSSNRGKEPDNTLLDFSIGKTVNAKTLVNFLREKNGWNIPLRLFDYNNEPEEVDFHIKVRHIKPSEKKINSEEIKDVQDICNQLSLPNSNNRTRSYSASQLKESHNINKEICNIRRSKSPSTYTELAAVSSSHITNLRENNSSVIKLSIPNISNGSRSKSASPCDLKKTNALLHLLPSKSPDYCKLSLPHRCNSQCSESNEFSYKSGRLPLKATHLELSWGSIKLGKDVKKSLQIKNTSFKRLVLKSEIKGPGFQIANNQKNSLITLHGQECRTLDIIFCPTIIGGATGKLIFHTPNQVSNSQQVISLYGYGGNAAIYLEAVARGPIGIPFITMGEYEHLSHTLEKTFFMNNQGPLKGFACVFIDSIGLDIPRIADSIEVLPSIAIIEPNSSVNFRIIFRPRSDDIKNISKKIKQVLTLANIKIITGDEVTRQRIRKLINIMNESEKNKILNTSIVRICEKFPTESEIPDLNIFKEKSDIVLELITSLDDHGIALTLNLPTLDDTFQTTLSFPEGGETILFRTLIPEESFAESLNEKLQTIKHKNGSISVEPNILEIDPFDKTINPILTIKSKLFSKTFFEIDSNFRFLFNFNPQTGELLPDEQVNIRISFQSKEIPTGQITLIVFFSDSEPILIPVRFKKDHFQ